MPTKLGQNFLTNKEIARKIIRSADLSSDDFMLEIGPGRGILTEELAKYSGKVVAVEIDAKLADLSKNRFKDQENVEIIEGNILKIDLSVLAKNHKPRTKNYKVIANLPYYITSPVIRKFLEAEFPPSVMILMVQREVAERIVAKPGGMSILAISVQYYARPEILFHVKRENFDPVPEVDSAVIKISNIKNKKSKIEDKDFFRVVRAGFCAKRKTLANNLANSFHRDKKAVEGILTGSSLDKRIRAQELSVEDWKKLTNSVIIKA